MSTFLHLIRCKRFLRKSPLKPLPMTRMCQKRPHAERSTGLKRAEQGQPIRRSSVRWRQAQGEGVGHSAPRTSARLPWSDHQALLQETLDDTAARAHAAESELAAREGDPEIHDDAMEELARSNKTLFQVVEDRAKQIEDLREKLVTAEGQVAYYKQYAAKLEEALQRGDA